VLLFAKEPAPGRVKTRLGRGLGDALAADLAWALLSDSLAAACRGAEGAGASLQLVHSPDEPSRELRRFLAERAPGAVLVPQGHGDLGARLARGLGRVRGRRLALGMDAPDLPAERISEALERLSAAPAVLGPTPDGGYYALGLGPDVDAGLLAAGIRWSSEHTRADTAQVLRTAGHTAELLPPHGDVDELEDLLALAARLEGDPTQAPACAAWLRSHPLPRPRGSP
jgi:rSAM/selenodomain-associated transferase 1